MTVADLSVCLIHRDDPHLVRTIESIRPFVGEICIVSEVENTVARSLADRFAIVADHVDADGRLNHFGAMRNASFALATRPWVMWIDADDVLVGGEHLAAAIARIALLPSPRLLFKYEYATDDKGRATHVQWRERIVRNDGSHQWRRHGHEKLVSVSGRVEDVYDWDVIVKHERVEAKESGRNLALLRLDAADDYADAAFELGLECAHNRLYDEAIKHLTFSWETSGRDDERVLAALRLFECHLAIDPMGSLIDPQIWAERAHELRPTWVEPHMALGRLALLRACLSRGEEQREWMREVLAHVEGARSGETRTPLAVMPLEQSVHAFGLEQAAHETLEQWPEALACVRRLIAANGEDPTLLLSERSCLEAMGLIDHADRLDIVIVAPSFTPDPWDPVVHREKGCGGSETAVIEMAKRLAARGHRVRVFGNPTLPGLYGGVEYHTFASGDGVSCDVLVAWRLAPMLDWCDAKVRLLWVHDTVAHGMTPQLALKADAILALSEWHKTNLVEQHGLHPDHVRVTRNGIDTARFAEAAAKRHPHRAIYSSSPDRGLGILLGLWPRIRAFVPDAELEVFYGFDGWRYGLGVRDDIQHRYVIAHMEERMRALENQGVTFRGKVDQQTLAEAMLAAGVWSYPTWFSETSCISAMEAQAAGLQIVTSPIAALKETVKVGTLVEGDWLAADYQAAFVKAVVDAMRSGDASEREATSQIAREAFSWDTVTGEWETMMREMLDGAAFGALPPYLPVAA